MISNAQKNYGFFVSMSADMVSLHCLICIHILMNNSKSTRPRDMLLHLKDTLSIEDDKLFKACISVCSSVRNLLMWLDLALGPV